MRSIEAASSIRGRNHRPTVSGSCLSPLCPVYITRRSSQRLELMTAPDGDAAEALALGAGGHRAGARAHDAGRTIDIAADDGEVLAHLGDFLDRGGEDLALGVEAEPLDPFPVVVQQGAGFVEAHPVAVRQQVETPLRIDPGIEQRVLGRPERGHGFVVLPLRLRIALDRPWESSRPARDADAPARADWTRGCRGGAGSARLRRR